MTSARASQAPHVPVLVDEVIAALALHDGGPWSTGPSERAATRAPCSRRGRDE